MPSLLSIVATFVMLAIISRRALSGPLSSDAAPVELQTGGRIVLAGVGLTALALLAASTFAKPLGATTFACGALSFALACRRDGTALRDVARSVS